MWCQSTARDHLLTHNSHICLARGWTFFVGCSWYAMVSIYQKWAKGRELETGSRVLKALPLMCTRIEGYPVQVWSYRRALMAQIFSKFHTGQSECPCWTMFTTEITFKVNMSITETVSGQCCLGNTGPWYSCGCYFHVNNVTIGVHLLWWPPLASWHTKMV